MKHLVATLILFASLLSGCGEQNQPDSKELMMEQEIEQVGRSDEGTLEERAKRHVESVLGIPGNEKYTLKIYREDLDADNKQDAVIVVNRLEFALNEAVRQGNTAKRAELGFIGNYNCFFFYDGGLDKISPKIDVPSTPQKELDVAFHHISSDQYKDIVIDFRVRNSKFREFYFVINHTPRKVFQQQVFDGLGTRNTEAYGIAYEEGTMASQKDIVILTAEMKAPSEEIDVFTYEPEIIVGKEMLYRFFYHPKLGKYAIRK